MELIQITLLSSAQTFLGDIDTGCRCEYKYKKIKARIWNVLRDWENERDEEEKNWLLKNGKNGSQDDNSKQKHQKHLQNQETDLWIQIASNYLDQKKETFSILKDFELSYESTCRRAGWSEKYISKCHERNIINSGTKCTNKKWLFYCNLVLIAFEWVKVTEVDGSVKNNCETWKDSNWRLLTCCRIEYCCGWKIDW